MSHNPVATTAIRTANRAAYDQVCEQETLDFAVARFSMAHPHVEECNFAAEVLIDSPDDEPPRRSPGGDNGGHCDLETADSRAEARLDAAFRQVGSFFSERGLTCYRWIPAALQDAERLDRFLAARGFARESSKVMMLRAASPAAPAAVASSAANRVLSARAMRRALERVLSERASTRPGIASELIDVDIGRLDDPQYECVVALRGDAPAGVAALHQVGEIGCIRDFYVMREHRRAGVGRDLLRHLIATARRWSLRPICAEISDSNTAAEALLHEAGFEEAGGLVSFRLLAGTEIAC